MPIYVDSTELRSSSRLPDIKGMCESTILEAVTGADIMISHLQMPATTETLILNHVRAGALLIQRKSGEDLVRSIGERINVSLAKMRSVGARQYQCILLSTGYFAPSFGDSDTWVGSLQQTGKGKPYITWRKVKWPYAALDSELRHFTMRGGVYIPLTCDEQIPGWVLAAEKDLVAFSSDSQRVKEIWPSANSYPPDLPLDDDPLQELRTVTDGRVVLAQFHGIGPAIATATWDTIREFRRKCMPDGDPALWEPDLATALVVLTGEKPGTIKVPGFGEGKRRAIREQLCIPAGMDFALIITDEKKWITGESSKEVDIDTSDKT